MAPIPQVGHVCILGLDPSTVASGWALLMVDGNEEGVTAGGVYRCHHIPKSDVDRRLLDAHRWLRGVMDVHSPALLAIETPFFKLNAQTLIGLAQIGAAFRLAATMARIPVLEVPPATRCTALGLAGNASKSQVLATVNAIYNLHLADHNEADAVAVAAAGALQWRSRLIDESARSLQER
jgi:crossover junction endodeoxyribonuclease RuvC